jgi:hypothetical protein
MKTLFIYIKHLILRIMKIAAKCPTCATYVDTNCVMYTGCPLLILGTQPPMTLTEALKNIDISFNKLDASAEKISNKVTDLYSNRFSGTKYPSASAVYNWVSSNYQPLLSFPVQPLLGFTPENVANKSTNTALGTSDTLYPTQNAVKTYVDNSISAIPVSNLQQVLDSGNSAVNQTITLQHSPAGIDIWRIKLNTTQGIISVEDLFIAQNKTEISPFGMKISNGVIGRDTSVVILGTAPGSNIINLPNANGTFVLSVNGVAPNDDGDVTLPITAPYKVYTASLTFNGTSNPIVTVYQNTIGDGSGDGVNDIAITIQNFGLWFEANMTGSTAFPAGKTWMQPSSYFGNNNSYNVYFYRMSNTQVRFQSIDTTDASVSFANGFSVNFEIRVYP